MPDKMLLSKALNPEQQHWSCSSATSEEIKNNFWKLCGVKQGDAENTESQAVLLLEKSLWTEPCSPSEYATEVRRAPTLRPSVTTFKIKNNPEKCST